jgi:hypothetical protein
MCGACYPGLIETAETSAPFLPFAAVSTRNRVNRWLHPSRHDDEVDSLTERDEADEPSTVSR